VKPLVTMRAALADEALLGQVLPGDSWAKWRIILIALVGEALTAPERRIWRQLTGRDREPGAMVEEALNLGGRRSGKTKASATLACWISGLNDHSDTLPAGERGVLPFLAVDQRQASIAFSYATAIFENSPLLRSMIVNRTGDTLNLNTRIDLEVRPALFRNVRGVTAVAAMVDEAAFLAAEGVNTDSEVLAALRPTLATTHGPLIVSTSPYAKRGEVWRLFQRHYGPAGDKAIVVVKGTSQELNPSLSPKVVARALERDDASARAEYLCEFRDDISALLSREAIRACIDVGVRERPPREHTRFSAFLDPAGGSGADSMCLCVASLEDGVVVIDAVRERRPRFSPESVVAEFSDLLKTYGISAVTSDRWGGDFLREPFRKRGIEVKLARKVKSDLYAAVVSTINSGKVRLLDDDRMVAQLASLERRTSRTGGRDVIDHPAYAGAHDDRANVVAGVVDVLLGKRIFDVLARPIVGPILFTGSPDSSDGYGDDEERAYRRSHPERQTGRQVFIGGIWP
jgi:hypothetical protein